jgi:hypothetical protein
MAIRSKETLSEEFIGTVTNNSDPDKCGRCKVRVFNIMDEIPDDMLPWATPIGQNMVFATKGAGAISIPKVGHIVRVRFVNGNIYCPEYWAIQHLDTDLINSIPICLIHSCSLIISELSAILTSKLVKV